MSKREARSIAAAGVDIDAPRAKRRKEAPATLNASPNGKAHTDTASTHENAKPSAENAEGGGEDKDAIREKGMQLWQILKDAVNKECVTFLL